MTIQTKINIGDPALIRYEDGMRLGVCTSIICTKTSIKYQFDIGDTYANIDNTCFENIVYFTIYDAVKYMKEARLFGSGI